MKKLLILFLFFNFSSSSFAEEIVGENVFPISTEIQMIKIKNLLDKAPPGIYLTVGGERAFIGASMFEGIDHLVVFDSSPTIVRYNKINIELLKASNKEQYKHLRWDSDFTAWNKTSPLLKTDDFKWWKENVRNLTGYNLPESLNKTGHGGANIYLPIRDKLIATYPEISNKFNNDVNIYLNNLKWEDIAHYQKDGKNPITKEEFEWFDSERKKQNSCVQQYINQPNTAIDWGKVIDYKSGNYLFDDKLYNRLHLLVMDNKIIVVEADIAKKEGMDLVSNILQEIEAKLAVLDLDNLYHYSYMGEKSFRIALSRFANLGMDNSILILMDNNLSFPCARFSMYIGFTFEHIKLWPKEFFVDVFIRSLPYNVSTLIDGRLYEAGDELPSYWIKKEGL